MRKRFLPPFGAPLKLRRGKGITAFHGAGLEAGAEPARALRRRAVGEGIGHDIALRALLQNVVADRRRGLQRRLDIAGLEKFPFLFRAVGPNPGEAIGLKLDANLHLVGPWLACLALQLMRLRQNAEQVLHMMADLVRDHVSLRELAGLAAGSAAVKLRFDLAEKAGVEINPPILGAI